MTAGREDGGCTVCRVNCRLACRCERTPVQAHANVTARHEQRENNNKKKKEEKGEKKMKVPRGAATTIKGKSGRAGLFRQRNCDASGNRNGRAIKKYDRALIDVKTTT